MNEQPPVSEHTLTSKHIVLLDQPDPFQQRLWQAALAAQEAQVINREGQEPVESLLVRYRPQLLILDMNSTYRAELNPYSFCRQCRHLYSDLHILLTNHRKPQIENVEVRWAKYQGAVGLLPGFRRVSDVIYAARLVNELCLGGAPLDSTTLKRYISQATQEARSRDQTVGEIEPIGRSVPKYPELVDQRPLPQISLVPKPAGTPAPRPISSLRPPLFGLNSVAKPPEEPEVLKDSLATGPQDGSEDDPLASMVELLNETYPSQPGTPPTQSTQESAPKLSFGQNSASNGSGSGLKPNPRRSQSSNGSLPVQPDSALTARPPRHEPSSPASKTRLMFRGRPIEPDEIEPENIPAAPTIPPAPAPPAAALNSTPIEPVRPPEPKPAPEKRSVMRFLKRLRPND
ncbi:hypothetical protein [Leptolyngbya sp. FACHB-261]|uniref:hypothetical protein n=1 Tax=Leptolyngbya sp. FACHB-261 TaxID=2692806 RepID=UPI001684E65D|nr:hypothetical protein [Leptolyngbya sp. FACHB-261]MBD2101999.1 hypothetical protein [Leptolyngbya sp. FACHB-261]